MLCKYAKRLHNENEVAIKETGRIVRVIQTEVNQCDEQIEVLCEDGNWHNHKEVP